MTMALAALGQRFPDTAWNGSPRLCRSRIDERDQSMIWLGCLKYLSRIASPVR